ncbi:MAG: YkoF family thiamine/hydroxymethylpyrimidine-binding protein [Chloroflexota bacterium]
MFLAAQISLYPLRQTHFTPGIKRAQEIFEKHGLTVEVGAMSSVLSGESEALFSALREVFETLAESGELVMMTTFSNACPVGR